MSLNQRSRACRRGIASMLAMLYLILFSVLAVGFYATTTVSNQLSYNEQRVVDAELAAETGMDFVRNALYQCDIPADVLKTNLIGEVAMDLEDLLNPTGNLIGNEVGLSGSKIEIPLGQNNYLNIGNGRKFRAEIQRDTSNDATPGADTMKLIVQVKGMVDGFGARGGNRAGITLTYSREERPTDFFKIGMASKGQVHVLTRNIVQGSPADQARILSLSTLVPPVTIGQAASTSYGGVAGDIYVPQGAPAPLVYPFWSVGGTTNSLDITANHIKYMTPDQIPPMPVPNTEIFRPFATNTFVAGLASYRNIVIPPNLNPIINGPTDIKGVVYVRQPNKVTFAGQCTITGMIVTENAGIGTLLTNQLIFSGNGGVKAGVQALPNDPEFIGLKQLAGSFIVAPGFDVQLTGNFGSISGHITGDKVTLSGATNSNVTGSIVALKSTLTIGGNTNATLLYDPSQGHAGMRFPDRYVPVAASYHESRH